MKKGLSPLFKGLLADLPDYCSDGRILLKAPIGSVLRAINFDPSGFDRETFYIDVFVMPLCVPSDHIHLTFGRRVSLRAKEWKIDMPDLLALVKEQLSVQALPFLAQCETLQDFVNFIPSVSRNPHAPKAVAYAVARLGDHQRAVQLIEDFIPSLNLNVHWEKAIFNQSVMLRNLLIYDPSKAAEKLRKWESDTIDNLKLTRFI